MWISHRKEIRKLTFRVLALRRSESILRCHVLLLLLASTFRKMVERVLVGLVEINTDFWGFFQWQLCKVNVSFIPSLHRFWYAYQFQFRTVFIAESSSCLALILTELGEISPLPSSLFVDASQLWTGLQKSVLTVLPETFNNSFYIGHWILFQVLIPCSWLFGLVINVPSFLVKNFDAKASFCIRRYPEEWMAKTYTLIWFLLLAFFPVVIMATLYSRVIHTLWFHRPPHHAFNARQQVWLD